MNKPELIDKSYLNKTRRELIKFNNELCKIEESLQKRIPSKKPITKERDEFERLRNHHLDFKKMFDDCMLKIKILESLNIVHGDCKKSAKLVKQITSRKRTTVCGMPQKKKPKSILKTAKENNSPQQEVKNDPPKGRFYPIDDLDHIATLTTPQELGMKLKEDLDQLGISRTSFYFYVLDMTMSKKLEVVTWTWQELDEITTDRYKLIYKWLNDEHRVERLNNKDGNIISCAKKKTTTTTIPQPDSENEIIEIKADL